MDVKQRIYESKIARGNGCNGHDSISMNEKMEFGKVVNVILLHYLQVTSCNCASSHKLQVQTNLNFELEWKVQNLDMSNDFIIFNFSLFNICFIFQFILIPFVIYLVFHCLGIVNLCFILSKLLQSPKSKLSKLKNIQKSKFQISRILNY